MLDQVLIAQASLQTLRLLTNLALVSAALIVIGIAGVWLTRRRTGGPASAARLLSRIGLGLGGLGAAALVILLTMAYLPRRLTHYEWTVDLRTEALLQPFQQDKCATWGAGERKYNECIYEGLTSLTAQFPGDRAIAQNGRALWASGRDGRLISLHHFLAPMTLDAVQTTVEPLIGPWHLQREHYASWLTRAATEDRAWYFAPADADRTEPWLELSVRPLEGSRGVDRVFAISLKWRWAEEP
jgi:hypothetical protein